MSPIHNHITAHHPTESPECRKVTFLYHRGWPSSRWLWCVAGHTLGRSWPRCHTLPPPSLWDPSYSTSTDRCLCRLLGPPAQQNISKHHQVCYYECSHAGPADGINKIANFHPLANVSVATKFHDNAQKTFSDISVQKLTSWPISDAREIAIGHRIAKISRFHLLCNMHVFAKFHGYWWN